MNTISRRRQYRQDSRDAILSAARELFVRKGYESFSMRELANKTGCSPGNIYLYFKNKDQIFGCLVENSFARLLETLKILDIEHGENPADVLRKGMHIYIDFGLQNPNDYRFAFLLSRPSEKRPYRVHEPFEVLRRIVRRCVKSGCFRPVNVEAASQTLWSSMHGITSLLIQRPAFPWVRQDRLISLAVDIAIGGFRAAGNGRGNKTRRKHGVRHHT